MERVDRDNLRKLLSSVEPQISKLADQGHAAPRLISILARALERALDEQVKRIP
jgi:hypothetical protein